MIFEDVKLGSWKGREYVIHAEEVTRAIAIAEQIVTLVELGVMRATGNLRLMQLCQALAAVMRHAGAEVTDAELYDTVFTAAGADLPRRAWATVSALEQLMIPPARLREAEAAAGKAAGGEEKPEASSPSATSSSSEAVG